MQAISLKDFILTGDFGPVYIGMFVEELKNHLGEPGDHYNSGNGSGLLFYNGFEFYYYTDSNMLYAIQNDNLRHEGPERKSAHLYYFNDTILVDSWFMEFGKPVTYKKVLERLRQEGIVFEEKARDDYDELIFPSGVTFDFENWKDNEGKQIISREEAVLNGIRYFSH